MTELAASDRAPGLLLGAGVEVPDDATIGGHVVIHAGVVIEPGCTIQSGAVVGKQLVLGARSRASGPSAEAVTLLEAGAAVGCHAVVVAGARIGPRALVGDHAIVREGVELGPESVVGFASGIGHHTTLGARSRLMNAYLAPHTVIEEDVFCGPNLTVTNDPTMGRHVGREGIRSAILRRACRVAANVLLLPGVEIGEEAMVGAGSLVTRSVAPRTVVFGSPAKVVREVSDEELYERFH